MKPEVGGESGMAQEEFDPLDMMSMVALLVLEARTPHCSAKGRVEGPHCPNSVHQMQHRCSKEQLECRRVLEFRQRSDHMWRNGIPSCIDVLLFPCCAHGMKEVQSLEGAGTSLQENFLLLERWNIQCMSKWHGEWLQGVSGSMLLQAVRSYLYFSQLSSWLASMHGCLPAYVVYRLYAPGEEGGVHFVQPPQSHVFPSGISGPHGVKVTVLSLPRQHSFPALLCVLGDQQTEKIGVNRVCQNKRKSYRKPLSDQAIGGMEARMHLDSPTKFSALSKMGQAFSNTSADVKVSSLNSVAACSEFTKRHSNLKSDSDLDGISRLDLQEHFQACELKTKGERSAVRDALESELQPLELPHLGPRSFDLHSPKVLMSEELQNTVPVSKRKQLDFSDPVHLSVGQTTLQLMKSVSHTPSPLSPLDVHVFLANLQSISSPIPAHPGWLQNTDYYPETQNTAKLKRFVGFRNCESKAKASGQLVGSVDQQSARFQKKKALPFGGDLPMPDSTEFRVTSDCFRSRSCVSSDVLLKDLAFIPTIDSPETMGGVGHSPQTRSPETTFGLGRTSQAEEEDKLIDKNDRARKFIDFGPHIEDNVDKMQKLNPVTQAINISSLEMLQHSTKHTLSESIDHTLRDLSKIVQSGFVAAQQSHNPHAVNEPLLELLSSSSLSHGVPVDDGEQNSDSSTLTNLSCSPCFDVMQTQIPHPKSLTCSGSSAIESNGDNACKISCFQLSPHTSVHEASPFTSETREEDVIRQHLELDNQGTCPEEEAVKENYSPEEKSFGNKENFICDLSVPDDKKVINLELPSVQPPSVHLFFDDKHCCDKPEKGKTQSQEKALHPPSDSIEYQSEQSCARTSGKEGSRSEEIVQPNKLICDIEKFEPNYTIDFSLKRSSGNVNIGRIGLIPDMNGKDEPWLVSSVKKLNLGEDHLNTNVAIHCLSCGSDICNTDKSHVESNGFTNKLSTNLKGQPMSEGCVEVSTECDLCLLLVDEPQPCSGQSLVSIAGSCQENEDNRQSGDVGQLSPNGTVEADVFYCPDFAQDEKSTCDNASQYKSCSTHGPTRTKSAPSFTVLAKSSLGDEGNLNQDESSRGRSVLKDKNAVKITGQDRLRLRLVKSASMMFNTRGSVPSQSSPAPVKRRSSGRFDYDETLSTTKAIKSAISMSRLPDVCRDSSDQLSDSGRILSTSAPASTNCLLGNFEESVLNGRLEPAGMVEGFSVNICASGTFCPRHLTLPVTAYFFNLSDDNAPSPYLGHINLDQVGKRGYHIPHKGTLQVTLFNPNKTVVKMFVVKYDLEDMPPNSQTVIRQRTLYMPVEPNSELPSYLRYLIHLRVSSSTSRKIYLHTDVRLIFARNKFELDSSVAWYELRSFTETPVNPKYSPKR